ncbi:MAG: response regulator transcription factor, partial [Bacteroidota bacterium]
ILDFQYLDHNRIDFIREIVKKHPYVKIILITIETDIEFILDTVNAGVNGCLSKSADIEEVFECIMVLKNGSRFFCKQMNQLLINGYIDYKKNDSPLKLKSLTKREYEVLEQLSIGSKAKHIAEILSIKVRTVDAHKQNLMRKLKLKNTIELIKFGLKNRIIEWQTIKKILQ